MMFKPFEILKFNKAEKELNKSLAKEAVRDKKLFKQPEVQPPIRASLVDLYKIDPYTEKMISLIKKNGLDIDYYASRNYFQKNNMVNRGGNTYVISDINEQDKFSEEYCDCTGVIAVGTDKTTGKQISFMSHQDPSEFLYDKKDLFVDDISVSLNNLFSAVDKGTVDVLIFGGNAGDNKYQESIKLTSRVVKEEIGIEPTILTGPNLIYDRTNVYFDTQHRRLYLVRPNQSNNATNQAYLASNYEEQKEKWKRE